MADAENDDLTQDVPTSFVEEAQEIIDIVHRVVEQDASDAANVCDLTESRLNTQLYKYQEQSQLLDAYLEELVQPLAGLLRKHAVTESLQVSDQEFVRIQDVCRLLNVLVVVRRYKTVVKFFPHEAADLEKVLNVLAAVKARSTSITSSEDGIAVWETQTTLLLWLSMLILTPFALATVDSMADAADSQGLPYTMLVARVLALCQEYLHHPGGVREMAALLLGRMLTRPDMGPALSEILDWSQRAIAVVDSLRAPFLIPGVIQTIAFIFKLGQRAQLLPYAPRVWSQLQGLMASPAVASNALARKLSIKLMQRVGLTFLQPRLAPWRYLKQEVDLGSALAMGDALPSFSAGSAQEATGHGNRHNKDDQGDGGDECEYEVPEEMEDIIERLLHALRDKDTIVRWSAAKGVGRITGCLPRELGDDVVTHVMDLFRPTESDTAWHGGCLALAELARRGLLLPDRLPVIVPIIQRALQYDVRRGPHSIGAHVRDAAAYVCWACARAYAPTVLEDSVTVLASSLLVLACYDREVNCRRAAAAAFQEAVGRLGNFPHGIDILAVADYFSVGNLSQAYLKVAPFVSSFPEYRTPLCQHLMQAKLRHWEKSLRELAARGLAALAPTCADIVSGEGGLAGLLPLCLDGVLEVRHGAVVGVAELLPALAAVGMPLAEADMAKVAGLVPAIDKARLYRGKGGEIMREAVSKLVAAISQVGLPLSKAQHAKVLEALDENLRHPHQAIQRCAVEALEQYTRAYMKGAELQAFEKYLSGYLTRLHDPNVAVRRGYAAALGAMPSWILQPIQDQVISALIDGSHAEDEVEERDVESRVSCVRALGHVCHTLYRHGAEGQGKGPAGCDSGGSGGSLHGGSDDDAAAAAAAASGAAAAGDVLIHKVLPCLEEALQDYTTDNRGDVGSWVREAAMDVMVDTIMLLLGGRGGAGRGTGPASQQAEALSGVATCAVGLLLKQAVERIARVREAAARHIQQLLAVPGLAALIPAAEQLQAVLPAAADAEVVGVTSSLEVLPRLAALLAVPQYLPYLLEGLIASIGGVDNSLSKLASNSLVHVMTTSTAAPLPNTSAEPHAEGDQHSHALLPAAAVHLLAIWQRHARSTRMATPLIRAADLLITRTDILTLDIVIPAKPSATSSAPATSAAGVQEQASEPAAAHVDAASGPAAAPLPGSSRQAPSSSVAVSLVELTRAESRQCSDVGRLLDAASLLCHLLAAPHPPCRTSAVQGVLALLANRYPKVRRHAAEQLYLQLMTMDAAELGEPPGAVDAATAEQAQELLLTTTWDGDINEAKTARNALAGLLQVPLPAMKAAAPSSGASARATRDENASYQSLLNDFARGY